MISNYFWFQKYAESAHNGSGWGRGKMGKLDDECRLVVKMTGDRGGQCILSLSPLRPCRLPVGEVHFSNNPIRVCGRGTPPASALINRAGEDVQSATDTPQSRGLALHLGREMHRSSRARSGPHSYPTHEPPIWE